MKIIKLALIFVIFIQKIINSNVNSNKDYYKILGIPKNSDENQVKLIITIQCL